MWWESDDNDAFIVDDQFMIGSDLVVAPIIKSGKIYYLINFLI